MLSGRALLLCVALVVSAPLLAAQTSKLPRYAVVSKLPLSQSENEVEGKIQIMEDSRLTPQLRKSLWNTGALDTGIDDDPTLAAFRREAPHNAQLRLIGADGAVLEVSSLERPLARLDVAKLYGTARLTYLVTVDYSAGFGSYSGPITMLVEVHNGHLRWVEATDKGTGKKEKISVMKSLKTSWKIADSVSGATKDFLEAACRPDMKRKVFASSDPNVQTSDDDFTLRYTRYYFDGSRWVRVSRQKPGFSEFEEGFPRRKLFP
jgi:hypothetical protein